MTVSECYNLLGADYASFLQTIGSEDRILKFLKKFAEDCSFNALCEGLENNNLEDAFLAVHTLKGICMNLYLTKLLKKSSELTELLRPKKEDERILPVFGELKELYTNTIKTIACINE